MEYVKKIKIGISHLQSSNSDGKDAKKEAFVQATVDWATKRLDYKEADKKLVERLLDLKAMEKDKEKK